MYLDYFGLRQKPFLITPDPAFLYPSQGHQQALAHLYYGLEREGGFVLLTGEVGTGKTTLCRLLIDELPDNFRLAYILNTKLDCAGVLAGICRELAIDHRDGENVNGLVAAIYDNLLEAHGSGLHTLVVIEEAQNLAPDVLETLRLLTNLETSTTKLLHILLVGQPELLETLARPGLRQLNQRVVSRSHLGALCRRELEQYLRHRISMAGGGRFMFSPAAIRLIYRTTGGIPRLVNLLAEHCLMGAYALGRQQISAAIVRRSAREVFATTGASVTGAGGDRSWWLAAAGFVGVLAVVSYSGLPLLDRAPQTSDRVAITSPPITDAPADIADLEQPEEISQDHVPVSEVQYAGAFALMLKAWGLEETPLSIEETCAIAATAQLRCDAVPLSSLADIVAINRPLLINLHNGSDGADYFFVTEVDGTTLTLANSGGVHQLPINLVVERLLGNAVVLWQAPAGYEGPLLTGMVNLPLVAALTEGLKRNGYLQEDLVTGGLYNDFLAQLVKKFQADQGLEVDGIVGVKTLMKLSGEDGPFLVMR